ncbi:hypothetical protein [Devosia sp.]|uniref:hypothetical protein n=1 Tax=Devosia sp. TaxID=1871048 RepID=UPI0025C28BA4|nr:hypothetical protein [Devosia sp.]
MTCLSMAPLLDSPTQGTIPAMSLGCWGQMNSIDWLKDYAPVAQFAAYSVLTVASVFVATIQFFLARRQNFGWGPVLFLRYSEHLTVHHSPTFSYLSFGFEFWNRRRYPLLVRDVFVSIENMRFQRTENDDPTNGFYFLGDRNLVQSDELIVEPTGHMSRDISLPVVLPPTGSVPENVSVRINFFDPRLNKDLSLTMSRLYQVGAENAHTLPVRRKNLGFGLPG